MAIKDDLSGIKDELNAQEQFLQGAIKTERFFKKFKLPLILVLLLGLGYGAFSYISSHIKEKESLENNILYQKALSSKDEKDIQALFNKAPNLAALVKFDELMKKDDINGVKELANTKGLDPILRDIFLASIGENAGGVLKDYNTLLAGAKALESGDISAAKAEFKKIPPTSALQSILKNLNHFQDIK